MVKERQNKPRESRSQNLIEIKTDINGYKRKKQWTYSINPKVLRRKQENSATIN